MLIRSVHAIHVHKNKILLVMGDALIFSVAVFSTVFHDTSQLVRDGSPYR